MDSQEKKIDHYLQPGACTDSDHPSIVAQTRELIKAAGTIQEKAKILFEFVRDQIEEDTFDSYKASDVLAAGKGFCYNKSILLAALCRAAGIPARLAFDHVTIHRTDKALQFLHGITEIYLAGSWFKYDATGNIKRWKMWCCEDHSSQQLPLEFNACGNVLFASSSNVVIKRTDYHYFDWSDAVDQFVATFVPST